MTPLRHPLLRRLLAGLLLSGLATWLLPPTVRASVLAASAAEPWLRHGRVEDESANDASGTTLDEQLHHQLVQTVAGVLALQGALTTTAGPTLTAGATPDKTAGITAHASGPGHAALASSPGSAPDEGARPAVLVRALSAARPLGP